MGKKVDFRLEKVAGPPHGTPWLWHTIDLRASPAWLARSTQLVKLLDLLELEHLRHGGAENGNLRQTYGQIEAGGVARKFIAATIAEGEALGLIQVQHGARVSRSESRMTVFRLTYLPASNRGDGRRYFTAPSDEWKLVTADKAKEVAALARSRRSNATGPAKNRTRCAEREPTQFPNGNRSSSRTGTALPETRKIASAKTRHSVPEREHPYISWVGAASAVTSSACFNSAIKRERLRQNLSLRALADLAGVSHSTVDRIERGKLDGPSLQKVAAALGMVTTAEAAQ